MAQHVIGSSRRSREKGMALAGVLIFAAVATFFSAALLHSLSVQSRLVQDKYNYTRALYLSESGLNRAAEAMWIGYLNTNPLPSARMAWLDAHYRDFDQSNIAVGDGGDTYTVSVRRVMTTGNSEERLIVFEATGNAVGGTNASDRTITRVVRFGHDQGSIFDYTYFINNFGWFWGSTIYANGDVRANANFDLKYTPRVNGDVYSSVNSDVGAAGTTTGTYTSWDLATYRSNAQSNWRPSRPEFQYGYSGTSQKFTQQDVLEMPYLGDINRFVALSESKNGTLHTDSVTLNGQPTTAVNIPHVINGPILLIGTAAHPIVIDGPVVVRGDVAIAGYVQGQGTIYSDRNVHIIGDILYKDPPSYDHAVGADPTVNAQHNTHADFLGLAARGNVILGDYTNSDFTNYVVNYIKPPFTASYTDEDGTRNSGDYTAVDGKKSDNSNRKKYEGTWTNTQFQSMVAQAKALFGRSDYKPRQIDALAYTNHLYAGRVQDCKFNGAIMSRDEGIVYNGSVTMNYDYRAKSEGEYYIDIDLPKAANAEPTVWLEGPYENWIAKLDPLDHSLTH